MVLVGKLDSNGTVTYQYIPVGEYYSKEQFIGLIVNYMHVPSDNVINYGAGSGFGS